MFSSLRARLLLSYLVVICVCLVLVTITLVLIARPIQERLLSLRMAIRVAQLAPRLQSVLDAGQTPAQVGQLLGRRAIGTDMRALLLATDGTILGDSADEWTGRQLPGIARQLGETRLTGSTVGPDGTSWVYAATPIGRNRPSGELWVVLVAAPPRPVTGLFGDLGEGILIAGGLALVCSALLAALVSRSVAQPLQQMAKVAGAIAGGDYSQKLDTRQPDEVRVLAESLATMMQQVKTSQQAMRDLVVNISHDLRTPLTSVQGFAQALVEGAARDEAARQHAAAIIYEEASRMVRMVEELGDMARIDSGQFKLERSPVDLPGLVRNVAQTLAPMFAEKGISLTTELPELPPVVADADRLTQVFTNLLDNALKYTPKDGHVQVAARQATAPAGRSPGATLRRGSADAPTPGDPHAGWVAVSVSDTGCGIPAEDLPRVFERFYQVDKARAARQGYGLGLAIAREIVEAHGGQIGVESLEGMGTRFTVTLPVASIRP